MALQLWRLGNKHTYIYDQIGIDTVLVYSNIDHLTMWMKCKDIVDYVTANYYFLMCIYLF